MNLKQLQGVPAFIQSAQVRPCSEYDESSPHGNGGGTVGGGEGGSDGGSQCGVPSAQLLGHERISKSIRAGVLTNVSPEAHG